MSTETTTSTAEKVEAPQNTAEKSPENVPAATDQGAKGTDTKSERELELERKLSEQGRVTKEQQKQLSEFKKWKEEQETKDLTETQKAEKELKSLRDEAERVKQENLSLEIKNTVAELVAAETELPEIKELRPFIKGSTTEEATDNFKALKKILTNIKNQWVENSTKQQTVGIPRVANRQSVEVNAFQDAKQKKDFAGMFNNSPVIGVIQGR
ncbi:MAG: hypothetical protein WCP97_00560 [bacterium]